MNSQAPSSHWASRASKAEHPQLLPNATGEPGVGGVDGEGRSAAPARCRPGSSSATPDTAHGNGSHSRAGSGQSPSSNPGACRRRSGPGAGDRVLVVGQVLVPVLGPVPVRSRSRSRSPSLDSSCWSRSTASAARLATASAEDLALRCSGVGDVLEVLEQVVGVDPGPAEDQLEVRLQPRAVERVGDPLDLGPAGGGQVVDGSVVEVVGPLDLVQGLVGPWVEPGEGGSPDGGKHGVHPSVWFGRRCGQRGARATTATGWRPDLGLHREGAPRLAGVATGGWRPAGPNRRARWSAAQAPGPGPLRPSTSARFSSPPRRRHSRPFVRPRVRPDPGAYKT